MKVEDLLSRMRGDRQVKITYEDKVISSFDGQFWKTIAPEVLNLQIKDVAFGGCVMIRVMSGVPVLVSTIKELQAAADDSSIRFIALAEDITGESEEQALLICGGGKKCLDLNGHTLYGAMSSCKAAIKVTDGCLEIIDSSDGDGSVESLLCSALIWADQGGCVVIHDGAFNGGYMNGTGSSTIYASGEGEVDIYGGYFKNLVYADTEEVKNLVLATDGDSANIVCVGGYYTQQDPEQYVEVGCISELMPDSDPAVYQVRKVLEDN